MKLWLDDVRPAPAGYDLIAKTVPQAKELYNKHELHIEHISFDHDLGENEESGYRFALHLESLAANGTGRRFTWSVHSANPAGSRRITACLESCERFWTLSNI